MEDRIVKTIEEYPLEETIWGRADVTTNVYCGHVLNMLKAKYGEKKIIHELLTRLEEQDTINKRILSTYTRLMTKEETNYIRTGKYE